MLIPKRHTESFFDLSASERDDLFELLDRAKLTLDREFKPQGYNIRVNDGCAAGQTVQHLHVHLIPRFLGDTPEARGGYVGLFRKKRSTGYEQLFTFDVRSECPSSF